MTIINFHSKTPATKQDDKQNLTNMLKHNTTKKKHNNHKNVNQMVGKVKEELELEYLETFSIIHRSVTNCN